MKKHIEVENRRTLNSLFLPMRTDGKTVIIMLTKRAAFHGSCHYKKMGDNVLVNFKIKREIKKMTFVFVCLTSQMKHIFSSERNKMYRKSSYISSKAWK